MDYDLDRFVSAQSDIYPEVVRELTNGRKVGHWMWFIFPQMRGLGRSETATLYGIASLEEAKVYLEHPLLGQRLRECTGLVIASGAMSLVAIFGPIDAMKFCSSMTLFAEAEREGGVFREALDRYCDGRPDLATIGLLRRLSLRA